VGLAVQLCKVTVEVETVVTAWYYHRQILDTRHNWIRKLADIGSSVDFILKVPSGGHFVVTSFNFISLSVLVCIGRLLFLLVILVQLTVWHMKPHLAEDVTFSLSIPKLTNTKVLTRLLQQTRKQLHFCRSRY
jgi:hypothetical protein